jgi:hypothetical protein
MNVHDSYLIRIFRCIHMYVFAYMCIHIRISIYTHICTHTNVCIHMYARIQTRIYVYTYRYLHLCMLPPAPGKFLFSTLKLKRKLKRGNFKVGLKP